MSFTASTHTPIPSVPMTVVSHLPVPQSPSVQQKRAHLSLKQLVPTAQKGPSLPQAPQSTTSFGGGKHTKRDVGAEPPRSQVSPLAVLQPSPVTGLHTDGGVGVHSDAQESEMHASNALSAALAAHVVGSPVPLLHSRQSASWLQLASSWQQLACPHVAHSPGVRMPLQSTAPPPVPVAVEVVPVLVVVVGPEPPEPVDDDDELVVSPPHAKGTRGAIATATRIQEQCFIYCPLGGVRFLEAPRKGLPPIACSRVYTIRRLETQLFPRSRSPTIAVVTSLLTVELESCAH